MSANQARTNPGFPDFSRVALSERNSACARASTFARRGAILCGILFAGGALGGASCDLTPLPEAVLEGTWKLVKDSETSGDNFTLLDFNAAAAVTSVTDVTGDLQVEQTNASGDITLTEHHVEVLTSTNLLFKGDFNDGFTEATGELFMRYDLFGVITTIKQGDATLTRQ